MDLYSIASAAIQAVNPSVVATIQVSTGSTQNADFSRTPSYANAQTVKVNLQALQYNDIIQADALNIQGVRKKMYIEGTVNGLVRDQNKGGDIVTLPDGSVWLVAVIAENWLPWNCAIITRQNGA